MLTENAVQSDVNLSVEENPNKGNCLVSQYENTPFLFVECDEGVFLAIGNNRLTDVMKDKECNLQCKILWFKSRSNQ